MPSEGAGRALFSHDGVQGIATTSSARAEASRAKPKGIATTSIARAAASRANGAKSKGPKTAEGKARASRNALKHGLCAKKYLLLHGDSSARFEALESALLEDLSPQGALQTLLAHRLIAAAWRLQRADRLELELFCAHDAIEGGLGRALVRDGRDAKVFPTLVRYRGAAMAEFFRTLKALKDLQAEAARNDVVDEVEVEKTRPARKGGTLCTRVDDSSPKATQNEPERCASGRQGDTQATPNEPEQRSPAHGAGTGTRNGPERGGNDHPCDTRATRYEPETPETRCAALLAAVGDLAGRRAADVGAEGGSRRHADGGSQGLRLHSPSA